MGASRRLVLALELEAEGEVPFGTLRSGERSWPFRGWLGLAVALESAIEAQRAASPLGGGTDAVSGDG
jgi:hypothetical protein